MTKPTTTTSTSEPEESSDTSDTSPFKRQNGSEHVIERVLRNLHAYKEFDTRPLEPKGIGCVSWITKGLGP